MATCLRSPWRCQCKSDTICGWRTKGQPPQREPWTLVESKSLWPRHGCCYHPQMLLLLQGVGGEGSGGTRGDLSPSLQWHLDNMHGLCNFSGGLSAILDCQLSLPCLQLRKAWWPGWFKDAAEGLGAAVVRWGHRPHCCGHRGPSSGAPSALISAGWTRGTSPRRLPCALLVQPFSLGAGWWGHQPEGRSA